MQRPQDPRAPAGTDRGFTLIEVLVALVILSTGIVVVLGAFETSLVALGEARDTVRAARILREALADARVAAQSGGAAGLTAAAGRLEAPDGWDGRLETEPLLPAAGRGGTTNRLYRVGVRASRRAVDREYALATFVRVREKP